MLVNLSVRNFALVKNLDISLDPGLTVITGESGAGKTILLQALSLVLGSRARKEQTRPGEQQCEVLAEFDITTAPVALSYLEKNELADSSEPTRCLIRRVARIDGRSRAWINGVQVTNDILRTLSEPLVALHGQFEQTRMVDKGVQLEWFDDFGVDDELRLQVESRFARWRESLSELEKTRARLGVELSEISLIRYQVEELEELKLEEQEFERLNRHFKRASQAHEVRHAIGQSMEILDARIRSDLTSISKLVARIDDEHESLAEAKKLLESAHIQAEECSSYLSTYAESLALDERELEQIEIRLNSIYEMARKHKVAPAQLFEHVDHMQGQLNSLEASQGRLKQLEQTVESCRQEFFVAAENLRAQRKAQAPLFCEQVISTLAQAALADAQFELSFDDAVNAHGIDSIEYLVSTNASYPPMSMGRIASGGELSRIALAILVVVAQRSNLPCLVLDEADIGIGGVTADMVGRMLRSLAADNQVLCVTHAPQVAALGKSHLHVFKTNDQEIRVTRLKDSERIDEIARMVASRAVDDESRSYARTLLASARS
ncbi:MAG: DNA repair protein RecN [Gammaproteobacteria bacterium]|nr:DNA repair protein RecN [Gammaproteobacteria bacterium]